MEDGGVEVADGGVVWMAIDTEGIVLFVFADSEEWEEDWGGPGNGLPWP